MSSINVFLGCLVLVAYTHAETINEQIEAINRAAPSERVEMMNRLKVQIASMNEAERSEALNALQYKGSNKRMQIHRNGVNEGSGGQYRYRMNAPANGRNQQGNR